MLLVSTTWWSASITVRNYLDAEQAAKQYTRDASDRIKANCLDSLSFIECATETIKSSEEAQTAQKDLTEQKNMAYWAKAMFWATVTSVIATSFGIVFVWLNFREARIATEAAAKSANVAEQALTQLERPFVVFKRTNSNQLPGGGIRLTIDWVNSGSSPTQFMVQGINVKITDQDLPENFSFPDFQYQRLIRSVLGPGAELRSGSIDLSIIQISAQIAGTHRIFLWCWTEYDDIFPETPRHRTEHCFEIKITGTAARPEVTFVGYPQHNGMDSECPAGRFRTLKGAEPNPDYNNQES